MLPQCQPTFEQKHQPDSMHQLSSTPPLQRLSRPTFESHLCQLSNPEHHRTIPPRTFRRHRQSLRRRMHPNPAFDLQASRRQLRLVRLLHQHLRQVLHKRQHRSLLHLHFPFPCPRQPCPARIRRKPAPLPPPSH
jgi:hypothetical protein